MTLAQFIEKIVNSQLYELSTLPLLVVDYNTKVLDIIKENVKANFKLEAD